LFYKLNFAIGACAGWVYWRVRYVLIMLVGLGVRLLTLILRRVNNFLMPDADEVRRRIKWRRETGQPIDDAFRRKLL
jgi:hypothetical protein